MASISSNLPNVVKDLVVVQGETENVLSAALREASTVVLNHVTANWPIDTGVSLAGWHIVKDAPLEFSIVNQVPYTSFVWIHPNQGGPPPLWVILIEEALVALEDDVTAFLSDRVLQLLEGAP